MYFEYIKETVRKGGTNICKSFIYNCRVFKLESDVISFLDYNPEMLRGRDIAEPFPRTYIEFEPTYFDGPEKFRLVGIGHDTVSEVFFHTLVTEDGKCLLLRPANLETIRYRMGNEYDEDQVKQTVIEFNQYIENMYYSLLGEISKRSHTYTEIQGFFKGKVIKARELKDVLPVITVSRESRFPRNHVEDTEMRPAIDWQHRWEVAGHWRRAKHGHDPNGEAILGRTWVKNFVKGPEDKPLVVKERRVKIQEVEDVDD